jgi:hypothetical protein
MTRFWITLAMLAVTGLLLGQGRQDAEHMPPADKQPEPAVCFEAVDVYIDSGKAPLAAYQFEFHAVFPDDQPGQVRIVGIEGGDHPAFSKPPYYDPAALMHNRVVIAAFNTNNAENLPTGRTRVARLHVQVVGAGRGDQEGRAKYLVELGVAANPEGANLPAVISTTSGDNQ